MIKTLKRRSNSNNRFIFNFIFFLYFIYVFLITNLFFRWITLRTRTMVHVRLIDDDDDGRKVQTSLSNKEYSSVFPRRVSVLCGRSCLQVTQTSRQPQDGKEWVLREELGFLFFLFRNRRFSSPRKESVTCSDTSWTLDQRKGRQTQT